MAMSRVLINFVRQKHLLSQIVPAISSKSIACHPFAISQRVYSSKNSISKSTAGGSDNNKLQVDYIEVVKDKTTFVWHLSIFVVGLSGAAIIFYYVFRELFSSNSPNSVYSKAFDKVINDPKIIDVFGLPMKAYGEETAKGRRARVKNLLYLRNGVEHMKMKFYIQGVNRKGTVQLEVRKNPEGKWSYRYLFVELKDRPRSVIVLEDNRDNEKNVFNDTKDSEELMPPNLTGEVLENKFI